MPSVLRRLTNLFRGPLPDEYPTNRPLKPLPTGKRLPVLMLDASAAADEAAGAVVIRSTNDPDFSAKRDTAEQKLEQSITLVLTAAGFRFDGTNWVRFGRNGSMTVSRSRSRWGYDCGLYVQFAPGRMVRKHQLWFDANQVALGKFYTQKEDPRTEPGRLHYLSIFESTGALETAMMILQTRVVPFIEEHLNGPGKTAIADFLPVAAAQTPTNK